MNLYVILDKTLCEENFIAKPLISMFTLLAICLNFLRNSIISFKYASMMQINSFLAPFHNEIILKKS